VAANGQAKRDALAQGRSAELGSGREGGAAQGRPEGLIPTSLSEIPTSAQKSRSSSREEFPLLNPIADRHNAGHSSFL
jgi:hypothetical protein